MSNAKALYKLKKLRKEVALARDIDWARWGRLGRDIAFLEALIKRKG